MYIFHDSAIPAQPAEGLPGVSVRWVIAENVGAPNFAMRVIEVAPGAATEHHAHIWEHEVYVLEGMGEVRDVGGQTAIGPGSCVYVAPSEVHQFINTGTSLLRFLCVIPIMG